MSEQIAYIDLVGSESSMQAVMTAAVLYGVKLDTKNTTNGLLPSAQRRHAVGESPQVVCPKAALLVSNFGLRRRGRRIERLYIEGLLYLSRVVVSSNH